MNLYTKDIHRPIDGVIKSNKLEQEAIKTELDEYVITRELGPYFAHFYDRYVRAIEEPTDNMGVWISGFFGSGKSHFLKVLSLLLDNKEVMGKRALEYFRDKVDDSFLFANMQRASDVTHGEVILFNIDSKADADSKRDKEAIVKVFMKVFDEHLGYFGSSPEIADFERRLDKQGKYDAFKEAYQTHSSLDWVEDRENWDFREDYILAALQDTLAMSREAAQSFFDKLEGNYSLSVDKFAKIIYDYVATKPAKHRLVFMVDEVGQYIGENPDLMLNLQTVAEDLGTRCGGRAWICVTSQEDIDSITKNRVRGNDFSKIQGRFKTRFSLSSANTDEVIKLRLLEKTEAASDSLKALYAAKEQVLKNQIRFKDAADMPSYKDSDDFVKSYPFVPYQFNLLQKVFTQVREHGRSGKHLSGGERSMLGAFQDAAQNLLGKPLGSLAPFHDFFPSVKDFLDGGIKSVISQAEDNTQLSKKDNKLLKTLFMIKYVKELKGNVETLVTLSLDHIDKDRLELKKQVEASLKNLEAQTLIQRSGDVFEFLTNEEQDVEREIRATSLRPDEVITELQKVVWEDVYPAKKYRFSNRHDYAYNRLIDDTSYGTQTAELSIQIISPYNDNYRDYTDTNAIMRSGSGNVLLVILPDERDLFDDLSSYLKTDKYIRQTSRDGLSANLTSILQTRAMENERRKTALNQEIENLIVDSRFYASGQRLEPSRASARDAINAGLKRLVENNYQKLGYIKSPFTNDDQLEEVLRSGTLAQTVEGETANHLAQTDMLHWIDDQQRRHQTVTLKRLDEHFSGRPYGWTNLDIEGVLIELLVQHKLELKRAQESVANHAIDVSQLWRRANIESYTVHVPRVFNPEAFRIARELARDYMSMADIPAEPQDLVDRYRQNLTVKLNNVKSHLVRARAGYPYKEQLEQHEELLDSLLKQNNTADFLDTLYEREDDFEDMCEAADYIEPFYKSQIEQFDKARAKLASFASDLRYLEDEGLRAKVTKAQAILAMPDPSKDIPNLPLLIEPVEQKLQDIKMQKQTEAKAKLQHALHELSQFAQESKLEPSTLPSLLLPLSDLEPAISQAESIDGVIARQTDIAARKDQITSEIIRLVNKPAEATTKQSKPIKAFKLSQLNPVGMIETEAQLEQFLSNLKTQLSDALKAGNRLKLD